MEQTARVSQRTLGMILNRLEAATNVLLSRIAVTEEASLAEQNAAMLTQAVGISIHSLRVLLDRSFMGARDAFGISRSICEASVNACYLLVEPTSADRASAYSLQRFYRDMTRDTTVAGFRLKVHSAYPVDTSDMTGFHRAMTLFTRSSGAEIREWSGKTIDQKIERIVEHGDAAKSLALSRLLIYGISSEILHGSPYGVMYFWTELGTMPATSTAAKRRMMTHYLTAILAAALALDGLIVTWTKVRPDCSFDWDPKWIYLILKRLVKYENSAAGEADP
jgi:hypothetical protein